MKKKSSNHDFTFILYLNFPPRTKKNHGRVVRNRRTGKPVHLPSDAYIKYERKVVEAVGTLGFVARPKLTGPGSGRLADRIYERQVEGLPHDRRPIGGPVNVRARYFLDAERRVDLNGLNQALHDALVAGGVLLDDSAVNPRIVVGTDGTRAEVDRDDPRTEVTITSA